MTMSGSQAGSASTVTQVTVSQMVVTPLEPQAGQARATPKSKKTRMRTATPASPKKKAKTATSSGIPPENEEVLQVSDDEGS